MTKLPPIEELENAVLKRDFSAEERKKLAGEGKALSDGCLAPETLVVTPDGDRSIRDLLGSRTLLTDQGWRAASVRSFGVQRLFAVTLWRAGAVRTVLATGGHRWPVGRGRWLTTRGLDEVLDRRSRADALKSSEVAVARNAEQAAHAASRAAVVHGERDGAVWRGGANGATAVLECEQAVVIGAVDAVPAAEGGLAVAQPSCVSTFDPGAVLPGVGPATVLAVGPAPVVPHVEVGVGTVAPTHRATDGADVIGGDAFGVSARHSPIPIQSAGWGVLRVEPTDRVEEVFCAIVPQLHRFVLAGGVLTGNSYPIPDADALRRAAVLARSGHGNASGAKALIVRRAKALGVKNPLEGEKASTSKSEERDTVAWDVKLIKGELEGKVYGIVLEPELEDSQGDICSAEDIEKACHAHMQEALAPDVQHSGRHAGAVLIENYIAQADFVLKSEDGEEAQVRKGSWVQAYLITDPVVKEEVRTRKLTGFSMEGTGIRLPLAA